MPISRTYECPDCLERFPFLHMTKDEPPPEHCPRCGNYMGVDPAPMPSLFSISSKVSKSADAVYRGMEEASAHRAEIVEQLTGESASNMKITNMRDNQRAGDVAAISTPNPVSQAMATAPQNFNFQPNAAAVGFEAQTKVGPFPRMGDQTRGRIAGMHHQMARQVTAAGQIASHRGKK